MTYRSGLKMGFPLAVGGHAWTMVVKQSPGAPRGSLWAASDGPRPALWRCWCCHEIVPDWALAEGFYSRPCRGRVRALAA